MPDYLPLCAFRLDLLPVACRSCTRWITSGLMPAGQDGAKARRHEWLANLETTWGSAGLLCLSDPTPSDPSAIETLAAIHYAPVAQVPRLRDLPLGPLPPDAALLFCLRVVSGHDEALARRLLQKAIAELRQRGVKEAFAYAAATSEKEGGGGCEFFSVQSLEDRGFEHVRDNGRLFLMRSDLGGLVTVLRRIEAMARRVIGAEPAPSPVAWSAWPSLPSFTERLLRNEPLKVLTHKNRH